MWPWLDTEHDGLRDSLRDAEPYYSAEPIMAMKVLDVERSEDLVAQAPGHWWTAKCRAQRFLEVRPRNPRHRRAPDIDCTCGFYAYKTFEEMGREALWWADAARCRSEWAGLWHVELAGLVIEHERGYRAERLRLVSQWQARNPVEVLHELGQGTTGQIRRACGYWSGNDSVHVRTALKAAARRGECVEVKTDVPNNRGGHLWVSLDSVRTGDT